MFTGLVEASCPVLAATPDGGRLRLEVDLEPLVAAGAAAGGAGDGAGRAATTDSARADADRPAAPVALGDSVALDGVCLTVAALPGGARAVFEVVPETLACTNLGALTPGRRVHAERALRLGDRLDGHLVQGHVETTGRLAARDQQEGQLRLEIEAPAAFLARCLPKGSVTVDGVSLTLAELGERSFAVALVPHTLEVTTLGERAVGERLNLEPDLIGQWVLRLMESRGV